MPSLRPCASSAGPGCCLPYVTKTRSPIVWIPNGAKCCGSLGSTKAPGVFTWFQLPSNTSTLPLLAKSVAYSRGPEGPFEMASPLNTAPDEDMSTVTCAAVRPMRRRRRGEVLRAWPRVRPVRDVACLHSPLFRSKEVLRKAGGYGFDAVRIQLGGVPPLVDVRHLIDRTDAELIHAAESDARAFGE